MIKKEIIALVSKVEIGFLSDTDADSGFGTNYCTLEKSHKSVYEKAVMDADSARGGKFSDESGNFFTISPYKQIDRIRKRK